MGERRGTYRVLVGKPEIGHLEVVDRDRRIIQKWILRKSVRRAWTGFVWLRIEVRSRLF
jgi:hypothetical protein